MTAVRRPTAPGTALSARLPALAAGFSAAGLVALAAATVVTTLFHVARTFRSIPQADEWFSLALYDRILQHGGPARLLFELHNEHRLVFPRLVFFSDYRFFGGSGLFDEAVIFATQAAEAGLFVWLATRLRTGAAARAALGAVATALLFSLQQNENLLWAFQVQFVGVFACASLCCTLFAFGVAAAPGDRAGPWMTAGAFVLVVVATFTMSNGLLAGPVLVVTAVLSRAPWRTVLAAAAVAAAAAVGFSLGYHPDADPEGLSDLLMHLPRVFAFAAGYLGTFARFGHASQIALGCWGFAATAVIVSVLAFRRERDPVRLSLIGIALFAAASALATAVGRSASGLEGVGASRYATGAAVFWAATIFNAWSLSREVAPGVLGRVAAALTAAILLEASATSQPARVLEMERRAVQYDAMGDAMLLGFYDLPALGAFAEPVEQARDMEPVLRRRHLSIFRSRDARLLGRPLADAEAPGAEPLACAGSFSTAVAVPALGVDGVTVSGTSSLRSRFGRPARVYIADAGGSVVGFAHTGFGDPRWTGYARARPGEDLAAWAVSDAGRPCRLGSLVVPPVSGG